MQSAEGFPFLWERLLLTVRQDYPGLYRAWFESLRLIELNGGVLRIAAPDVSYAGYLRETCIPAFTQAAMVCTGHLVTVQFVAPDDLNRIDTGRSLSPVLTRVQPNADYTFEEFVVGASNRLAHAACKASSAQPGTLYNPIFIHGNPGLGKSHLLQATCDAVMKNHPGADVAYMSCETFVNDFVRAIQNGQMQAFRDTARRCDVFVIDDVHFLGRREGSQEEFFHTFNALYQAKRQIILSGDAPPNDIKNLEERLLSRFQWGLVAPLDAPNREMRQAILQRKAKLRGVEIPEEVLDYIARHIDSSIRALEGALTTLITQAQLLDKPYTLDTVRALLPTYDAGDSRRVRVSDIQELVAKHFGVKVNELNGQRRTRSVALPRQVAIYLTRKLTKLSSKEIGGYFGNRDHSTVLHAHKTIEEAATQDPTLAHTISQLTRLLNNRA